jgi:hypothetical protein
MRSILFLALAACSPAVADDSAVPPLDVIPDESCTPYQYVELITAQSGPVFRVDLDNAMREQTPRIEACVYDAAWVCTPCSVGIYATDPHREPYPEGGQAFTDRCSVRTDVVYRVTHTLCGEE